MLVDLVFRIKWTISNVRQQVCIIVLCLLPEQIESFSKRNGIMHEIRAGKTNHESLYTFS